ncbi:hypothetical protein L1987_47929 [Smallanthus sonchifolius]|uniref:Uncharacterized protein n=1 Tax=Smallanthus sonchifolius TaxID=185202 RepID=A0ACB9FQD5_9ASTR|nr:hypothetical protein L1987_47929 [Smallanthus sonchifolius]
MNSVPLFLGFSDSTFAKRAVDRSLDDDEWGLVTWAQDSIKEGNLKRIIDSGIRGEISRKCLKEFIRITVRCLHSSPKQRPTMAEVVVSLESVLAVQEKLNNSLQAAGRTIFGRMVDLLPFTSNGENSVQSDSKLSSNSNGNNRSTVRAITEVPAHFQRRRALDVERPEGQQSLVDWASSIQLNRRNLKEIMDPRLEHNYLLQGAFECVALALRCVANKPKDRPSSEEVLQSLEQIYALYN